MKKLLALVLALVMTLSLCITSNAAYAGEEFDYDEAVEVMTAIGVFQGDENGKFDAKGILTREQAAKIVTYMILGKTAADALVTIAAPFADVEATRWSAGSIAYCYNEGILAGVGNGMFAPTAELTGLAFAKMMLCALGYKAEQEGLTGSEWSINVAKLALTTGLTDDMDDVSLTAPMTREQAAKMAFNTLTADMVEYLNNSTITAGNVTVTTTSSATKVGNRLDKDYRSDADEDADTVMQFCEKYVSKLALEVSSDNFGRPANIWSYKDKEVGTFAVEADATFTTKFTKADLYKAIGKSVANKLGDGEDDYTVAYVLDGNDDVDGVGVFDTDDFDYNVVENIVADKSSSDKLGANGLLVEIYVDDDEDAEAQVLVVMINTFVGQVSDDYDADDEGLFFDTNDEYAIEGFVSDDDFDGLKNFKEDDYVLYTAYEDGDGYTIASFKAAKTVNAAVTKYTKGKNFTAGGETYEYALNQICADDLSTVTYTLKDEIVIVLDPYGYVIATDDVETEDKYVFIGELAQDGILTKSKYVADAFFTDGTREEITVKKVWSDKTNAGTDGYEEDLETFDNYGWFTYTVKDGKYTLTPVDDSLEYNDAVAATTVMTTNGDAEFTDGSETYDATKSTVFVVLDDDVVKTYTGFKAVPSFTVKATKTATMAVVLNDDDYATYVFIDVTDSSAKGATTKDSDVIFLLKDSCDENVDEDDNTYYTYDALVNGKKTTLKANNNTELAAIGLYIDAVYDSNGYLDEAELVVDEYDYDTRDDDDAAYLEIDTLTTKGNVITIGDEKFILDDDCVIRTIDGTTVKTVTAAKLADLVADDDVPGPAAGATVYVTLKDGEVTAMFVLYAED